MAAGTMTRRDMLKLSGITALGVGGVLSAGLVARASTSGLLSAGEETAYDAWDVQLGGGSTRSLVAAAILAASPHNTQPWRFAVNGDAVDVIADRGRALRATDPEDVELITGLGCAIENMAVAAAATGRTTIVDVGRTGSALARVSFRSSGAVQGADLFPAIASRHTNRGPYRDDRTVPDGSLAAGAALLDTLPLVRLTWLDGAERDRFGDLVVRATEAVIDDRAQSDEINQWWRASRDEIDRHRDGMTLDAQSLPPVTLLLAKVLPPTSQPQNDESWLRSTRDVHVGTAAAYGLLSVERPTDDTARVQVGRAFQRLHLWATTRGLALQPLNQVTERIDRDRSLGRTSSFEGPLTDLTPRGRTTLFAFRIGVPTVAAGRSPRRPLEDVIAG